MTAAGHGIPESAFLALAAGAGGEAAVRYLRAAEHGKHLLLVRHLRDVAESTGHPGAGRTREAYAVLAEIEKADPDAVAAVLRYPTVGVWARRTLLALQGHGTLPARPEQMAALAAAAAVRAGRAADIEVPAGRGTVLLPSLGRAVFPAGTGSAVVRAGHRPSLTADGLTICVPADPHEDAPGWQALRVLTAEHRGSRARFVLDDLDPDRMPGATVLSRRLTGPELARWRATLRRAWALLARRHWTICAETTGAVTALTPLASDGAGHTSATARHAFGAVGLSPPYGSRFLSVTFAHEVQHTKLTALLDLVALTEPDDGRRYYAPWRNDPRPVAGLLQGAYAHLGIAGFWRRQRHHEPSALALSAHTDFVRWRDAALWIARTLVASGRLTAPGETFVAGMCRTLEAWRREPVPPPAIVAARTEADRHLSDRCADHGPLVPVQQATRPR
ncbi:HEXXH motif domain-containing protein [Actinomadura macra]|uniref:HEXXH motif domain-containing protein n=1 Tax=Actinomadura macra TaxID=46164 RepID=UPI000B231067|nr:HEXXH motif domain-containing protein [Actinomadura macra]